MQENAVSKTTWMVWKMKNNLFLKQIFFVIIICFLFTFLLRISIEHSTEIYGIVAYFGICAVFGFLMGNAINFLERTKSKTYTVKYICSECMKHKIKFYSPKG